MRISDPGTLDRISTILPAFPSAFILGTTPAAFQFSRKSADFVQEVDRPVLFFMRDR